MSRKAQRTSRSGFTLVELLVVIAIITLLLALAIVGYRYVAASSARNAAIAQLSVMDGLYSQIEQQLRVIDSPLIRISVNATSGNLTTDANQVAMMRLIYAVPRNKEAIDRLPVESITRVNAVPFILDPWGQPMVFVGTGGLTNVDGGAGTITVPGTGRPFFVSRGPDKSLSNSAQSSSSRVDDNLYSFQK